MGFGSGRGSHIPTDWFRVGTAHLLYCQNIPTSSHGSHQNFRNRESVTT